MVQEENKAKSFLQNVGLFWIIFAVFAYPIVGYIFNKVCATELHKYNPTEHILFNIHQGLTSLFLSILVLSLITIKRKRKFIKNFIVLYSAVYVLFSLLFMLTGSNEYIVSETVYCFFASVGMTITTLITFSGSPEKPLNESKNDETQKKSKNDKKRFKRKKRDFFEERTFLVEKKYLLEKVKYKLRYKKDFFEERTFSVGKNHLYVETKYELRYKEITESLKKIQNKEHLLDLEVMHKIKKMSKELEIAYSLYDEVEDKLLAEKEIEIMFDRIEKKIKECLHSIDKNRIRELKKINMQYESAE